MFVILSAAARWRQPLRAVEGDSCVDGVMTAELPEAVWVSLPAGLARSRAVGARRLSRSGASRDM